MADVSRETELPPSPEVLRQMLAADQAVLMERYAAFLATDGVTRGLLGPREVPRLWSRHLLNCLGVAQVANAGASVCDVGTGAGLPGLVVAIARPDVVVTLVEPLLRRTVFLQDVVDRLGLHNVHVRRGRADDLHGAAVFDLVTSRAVAPLGRLLEWSMPLVSPAGELIAMKGSGAAEEVAQSQSVWSPLGCAVPQVVSLGGDRDETRATAVRVVWAEPSRVRSEGAPAGRQPVRQRRPTSSPTSTKRRKRS